MIREIEKFSNLREITNNKMEKSKNNAVWGYIIGVIGILITISIFIIQSYSYSGISYSESATDTITQSGVSSKLKVYYDSVLCQKVMSVKIAIWNSGKGYIDKNDISTTNPLIISSTANAKILEVKIARKTRADLNITADIIKNNDDNSAIKIGIIGDDGFEEKDGFTLFILYSSNIGSNWKLTGHIKGSRNSLKKIDWSNIKNTGYSSIFIFAILAAVFVGFIVRNYSIKNWRDYKIGSYIGLAILVCICAFFIYGTIYSILQLIEFNNLDALFS